MFKDNNQCASFGILYIAATSIGNMNDITLRVLDIMRTCDVIAAEDTRETYHLLAHHGIEGKKMYHYRDDEKSVRNLLNVLQNGENIVLVSDAGTPVISDPGHRLIRACADAGVKVSPLPGASAMTAALSVSHLISSKYVFWGFINNYDVELQNIADLNMSDDLCIIVFESAKRLLKLLERCFSIIGDCDIMIGREITKIHEEFFRGNISEALKYYGCNNVGSDDGVEYGGVLKGEFVVLINLSCAQIAKKKSDNRLMEEAHFLFDNNVQPKVASRILAKYLKLSRKSCYDAMLAVEKEKSAR